jgi:hypothetical protein
VIANPELRRNLWLEATPARLVLVPAILAGVFFLAYVADEHHLGSATALTALAALGLLTWGWGAHLASESVLSELRGRTWDWQRMSGLGGWTLTWGKLAGATFPAWYGAAFCLLVYAAATPGDGEGKGWMAALVVLGGILAQAGTFFAALHGASRGRVATRAQSSFWLVAGAVVLLQLFTGASRRSELGWYGLTPTPLQFGTASVGAFAVFAVLGAWARVRRELRIRTLTVVWPAFLLFTMVWAAGFPGGDGAASGARAVAAFLVAVAATWGTALLDPKDPVALRRLAGAARAGRWRTVAEDVPPWLVGVPFVLGAWVLVLATAVQALDARDVRPMSAAIVLFLARDLALVLFLGLGARRRRADLLAFVLLASAYVLVPLVLSASHLRAAAALLFPDPERGWLSAVSALVQAVVAGGLLVERWRARAREVEAGAQPDARR